MASMSMSFFASAATAILLSASIEAEVNLSPSPTSSFVVSVKKGRAADSPSGVSAGQTTVTLEPGELRTFIQRYSFDATTAGLLVAVLATPSLPDFVDFAFNGADRVNQTVTIQYRLEVDNDAPGGSFPASIRFDFLNIGGSTVVTRELNFTLIIDAPPPPDDHGDDCAAATPLNLNDSAAGTIAAGGDVDFFRLTLTETGTVTVFTTGGTDTVGSLLEEDCTPIAMDEDAGVGSNFRIRQLLSPGVYHVSVGHAEVNGSGDYVLNAEFEPFDPFVHELYFAQFANGLGLTSQLQLLSLNGETRARIGIRNNDGDPLSLVLTGIGSAPAGEGEMELVVPASGLISLQTDGLGNPVEGAVTVRSEQPLAGVLIFGGEFGLAGVDSSSALDNRFVAPVQSNAQAEANTGVAVQNLEEVEITFDAELLDPSGNLLANAVFSVPPNGHAALFVTQLDWDPVVDFTDFSGILRVSSRGLRFAATALLTRPSQLASLPVVAPPAAPEP